MRMRNGREGDVQPLAPRGAAGLVGARAPGVLDVHELEIGGEGGEEQRGPRRAVSPGLLLRYKWSMLLVFVGVVALTVPPLWLLHEATYRATGVIEVGSRSKRYVMSTEDTGPNLQYTRYLQTQVATMTSDTVLERVLDRADVKRTAWFSEAGTRLQRLLGQSRTPLERLREAVTAGQMRGTEYVEVAAVARRPVDAKILSDAVREEYIRFARDRISTEDLKLISDLTDERRQLEIDIRILKERIDDATVDLRTTSPEQRLAQRATLLEKKEGELDEVNLSIIIKREQLDRLGGAATSQPSEDALAGQERYEPDAEWQRLRLRLQEAERRIADNADRLGAEHPVMRSFERARREAQDALDERQAEIDRRLEAGLPVMAYLAPDQSASPVATLQRELSLLEIERDRLTRRVEELRASLDSALAQTAPLEEFKQQLLEKESRLAKVKLRLMELNESARVPQSIGTLSAAAVPTRPVNGGKPLKYTVVLVFGGLFAAVGTAYLRLVYSPQVQAIDEVRRDARGAFLGHLPLRRERTALALADCPIQGECVRLIRTALLHRLGPGGGHIVQITSATPGAGKSTFAILLAKSFAQYGKRVLLVDTDVRRPTLAQRFALDPSPGLMTLLADPQSGGGAIRSTAIPRLSIVPAGKLDRSERVELLANGVFAALQEQWRKEFDIVLFDGAPLLGPADAAILSRQVDGTVMVVRERRCRREDIIESLAVLSAAGGRLLGTVFVGSGGSTAYGYGYGYGYGPEPTAKEPGSVDAEVAS
jgi:succinoglycan biosynthesis transport protein ExoP